MKKRTKAILAMSPGIISGLGLCGYFAYLHPICGYFAYLHPIITLIVLLTSAIILAFFWGLSVLLFDI